MSQEKSRCDYIKVEGKPLRFSKKNIPTPTIPYTEEPNEMESPTEQNTYSPPHVVIPFEDQTQNNSQGVGDGDSDSTWHSISIGGQRITFLQVVLLILCIPIAILLGVISIQAGRFFFTPHGQILSVAMTFLLFLMMWKHIFP